MSITVSAGTTSSMLSKATIYAGHICSHCQNPIVKIINVQAKAKGRTSGLGKTSEDELAQKSAVTTQKGVERLSSYLQNPSLQTYPEDTDHISYQGWNVACPVCGKYESWQTTHGLRTEPFLSQINTFPNMDSAYEWAKGTLQNRKNEADLILTSDEKKAVVLSLQEETIAMQCDLQVELENGEAVQQVSMLKKKHEELSKKLKGQGIFSKEKKYTQKELENCEEEIKNAEKQLKNESNRIKAEIAKAEIKIKECKLLQLHYADEGYLFRKEESFAVRLREIDEVGAAGYIVSLQPLPRFVSVQVSSFEKNKDLLNNALLSLLLEKTSELKGDIQ